MRILPSLKMKFDPNAWNKPELIERANCYAYALNAPTLGRIDFGGLTEGIEIPLYAEFVKDPTIAFNYAVGDGLVPANEQDLDPTKNHIVALFTGAVSWKFSVFDYHFFRLDGDGNWSHKEGYSDESKVIKVHCDGNPYNPDILHRAYKEGTLESHFIGFFKIPKEGLVVMPISPYR